MGELWETLGRNASEMEVQWSVPCFIVFILAVWRLVKFGVLFFRMKRRNGQYVEERHMALIRISRYLERSYVLGICAAVGVLAMLTPEPVREANREASVLVGRLFLSITFAMLIGSVLEEWLEWNFPSRGVSKGRK